MLLAAASLLAGLLQGPGALLLKDGRIVQDRPLARVGPGIEVTFQSGAVFVPDALIHLALLEGEPDPPPKDEAEREKYAKGLVPFEGQWMTRKRREELLEKRFAARRAEIADNLAHREWKDRRHEETKNFRFESTVPLHVFKNYCERVEAYYQVFAKDWKLRAPEGGKLSVCFYADQKEFYRTSGAGYGTLAYFKFVEPYELNVFYEPLDPILTEQVFYHEANHYLQKLIDEDFSYPHWPGEALAEFYGASSWDPEKKRLTVGLLQEGRLAEIQDDIARGEWWGIEKLVSDEHYEHYTWGWALVYYLMNHETHRENFKRFVVSLASGKDVRQVPYAYGLKTVEPAEVLAGLRRALRVVDDKAFRELERDWHKTLEGEMLAGLSTRGLELAAGKALSTGRKLRAQRLFEEAIGRGSTNAQLYHQYAKLLEHEERSKAVEMSRKAVELAPLTGAYCYTLGSLLERTDKVEGKRLKTLALEIDPEFDPRGFAWDF